MGFRTVVVLNNDKADEWESDPYLGEKIMAAASYRENYFPYGKIVEQVHADTQSLISLDGYAGDVVASTHWHRGQSDEVRNLALLKDMAEHMGYRISKKPIKK